MNDARTMLGKNQINTNTQLQTVSNDAMNDARTMLGKNQINTNTQLQTVSNDAMNDVRTMLEGCRAISYCMKLNWAYLLFEI